MRGDSMALLGLEQDRIKTPRARSSPLAPRMRRLGREHRAELQDFLLRLDRDSRCRRFGHAASDDVVAAHAVTALEDAGVIGAFVDESLRGALEIYSCAPHGAPEAALVVDQSWRRRGLGWALLCAAAGSEAQGIRLIFTRDNWPMRHLASKANARFDLVLDEICAEVTPARLRV
jgi:GNAT superfamily N-acetyltransferase